MKDTATLGKTTAYVPVDADFKLKDNAGDIAIDTNFASQSFWKDVFIRYFRKTSAVVGLVLIILISLMAVIGPGMNEYTYSGQELSQKNFAPRVKFLENFRIFDGSESMKTTTGSMKINYYEDKGLDDVYYWFGSDNFGRDIWTRTWSGARVSPIIAVAAAIIDMLIGMSYGLISGYFGGKTDMVMQRFLEIANGIPVPQCSLGSLISEGFNSFTTHPYQIIPPIVVMALLMLSFNLVGDGLREALDPKMKEM